MADPAPRVRRRGSVAAGIVGIIAGLLGIGLIWGPYLNVVQHIGEVSSGGFFLIFWLWDPAFATAMTAGGVVLIAAGGLLLILVRRDARPKLRRAVLTFTLAEAVLMLGVVGYEVVKTEKAIQQGLERLHS